MATIKKGNWVEFTMKGETFQAIVVKGGAKLKVHFGFKGNTCRVVTAPSSMFKLIPTPNMDESGIMNAYELKAYKEAGGEETIRFEAKLYKNGKPLALVSNGGYGGCDDYYPIGKATHKDIEQFREDAKAWAIHYGEEEPFEAESYWIEWITGAKPKGMNSKLYWEDSIKQHAEFNKRNS